MENINAPLPIEPRWPAALTILLVLFLLAVLPDRIRLFPAWFHIIPGIVVLGVMTAASVSDAKTRWLRVERIVMFLFCGLTGAATLVGLAYLLYEMIAHSTELNGLQLLTSSISVWVMNVLVFSLLYWESDRGGPEARLHQWGIQPDWLFPRPDDRDATPPSWRSTYVDYLFLAYTSATAFSPADTIPLTARAKLMLMLESGISLTTTIMVASRAINILGS